MAAESPRPPSLLAQPSYLASQVSKFGARQLETVLAQHGLLLGHEAILSALDDFGPLSQQQLAHSLDSHKSNLVGRIDDLERRGLVTRTPTDRRPHCGPPRPDRWNACSGWSMLEDAMHDLAADREPSSATFLFADIAGFTALTEAHGDEEAARVVSDFCEAVARELPAFGAEHIKTIGDALMLRVPDPGQAVLLGLLIALDVMRGHRAPAVRVGLHHGRAIERDGDYFGATVNLAARVSAAATGGEVLMTGQTAARARDLEGVRYESRGSSALRNVREPVELVAAVRQGQTSEHRLTIDPVCRVAVIPEHAAGRLVIDDTVFYFCSLTCAGAFAREPERFVD